MIFYVFMFFFHFSYVFFNLYYTHGFIIYVLYMYLNYIRLRLAL